MNFCHFCVHAEPNVLTRRSQNQLAVSASRKLLAEELSKEAALVAGLRHPNIVMFLGVSLNPPCMVTEFCARGSLMDVLYRARTNKVRNIPLCCLVMHSHISSLVLTMSAHVFCFLSACSTTHAHRPVTSRANFQCDVPFAGGGNGAGLAAAAAAAA